MFRLNILFVLVLIVASSCNNQPGFVKNKSHQNVPDASIANGKALAAQYCQSCHALPDPSLLSAEVWENGVLPAMGPRLGIFEYKFKKYINSLGDPNIKNYYPLQPIITPDQWQNIIDYYTSIAPDTLPAQKNTQSIDTNFALFTAVLPEKQNDNPTTCFIAADTINHRIYTADVVKHAVYLYNSQLQLQDSVITGGSIVQLLQQQNGNTIACNIGTFSPANASAGAIQNIATEGLTFGHNATTIYNHLTRPVHLTEADINVDGKQDFVVCEFGYLIGALSWLENKGNSTYEKHVLRNMPGAVKTIVRDFNNDAKPDVIALFAQGDEGVFLFTNNGNGNFTTKQLLRFPPSYGSSYFELDDFNNDGHPDILYTCGDNADYSPILKPYHGVYIYLNDGQNNFKQTFFYPLNGCYKAVAKDFDGDGDLDIAAIAYFADFAHQPNEGFVYLENKGDFSFQPFSLPATRQGRWINMDVADVDGNGKQDILLANCSVGPTVNYAAFNWKQGPPFMILKNIGDRASGK